MRRVDRNLLILKKNDRKRKIRTKSRQGSGNDGCF